MKALVFAVLVLIACVASALAHEADMRRAIRKHGHTRHAGWLGRIKGTIEQ
jgi:hypothetical protein